MTIEVKNCHECPLIDYDMDGIRDKCNHPNGVGVNKTIQKWTNLQNLECNVYQSTHYYDVSEYE